MTAVGDCARRTFDPLHCTNGTKEAPAYRDDKVDGLDATAMSPNAVLPPILNCTAQPGTLPGWRTMGARRWQHLILRDALNKSRLDTAIGAGEESEQEAEVESPPGHAIADCKSIHHIPSDCTRKVALASAVTTERPL